MEWILTQRFYEITYISEDWQTPNFFSLPGYANEQQSILSPSGQRYKRENGQILYRIQAFSRQRDFVALRIDFTTSKKQKLFLHLFFILYLT